MTSSIKWPDKYLPGLVDNFVSNEVFVTGLSAADIWPLVADITKWESYYDNCSQITPPSSGPELDKDDTFSFATFGFPPLDCVVRESIGPSAGEKSGDGHGVAARIAWEASGDSFECYHAWIIEELSHGRTRIFTQESQLGQPAKDLANKEPEKMWKGHQKWLTGLEKAARQAKSKSS